MNLTSFKDIKKDQGCDKEEVNESIIDIKKINSDLCYFYNKLAHIHEIFLNNYEAYLELEKDLKKNKESIKIFKEVKNFFETTSKECFYTKKFFEETTDVIRKLSIDEVSNLKIRKLCYHYLSATIKNKEDNIKLNNTLILEAEVFRFGGDEFIAVISRNVGVEIIFFDMMYLNYFNELCGHAGGDAAIFNMSRIIEQTLKSFIGQNIKTKDIIDKTLSNIHNFEFSDRFDILNKIILHVDCGYSNDGELKYIEKKLQKICNDSSQALLTLREKRQILIEIADARASFQKRVSKLYILSHLQERAKKDSKIKEIFTGYISFTKKMNSILPLLKKLNSLSTEEAKVAHIVDQSIRVEIKKYRESLKSKTSERERILFQLSFTQAISNISKLKPKIDIEEVVRKWNLD